MTAYVEVKLDVSLESYAQCQKPAETRYMTVSEIEQKTQVVRSLAWLPLSLTK